MSDIITASELTEQEHKRGIKQQEPFVLGTVKELFTNGNAKITFDGEDVPSNKKYSYLASYSPNVSDRVLLIKISGTYIIIGKINYNG